tara:strand:+ start:1399 stop:1845 length:447 start_codon:yes stop_codon:yes gene_type:complete
MIKIFYKNELFSIKNDELNNIIFLICNGEKVNKEQQQLYHEKLIELIKNYELLKKKVSLVFNIGKNKNPAKLINFINREVKFQKEYENYFNKHVDIITITVNSNILKTLFNTTIKLFRKKDTNVKLQINNSFEESLDFIKNFKILKTE